MSEQSNIDWDSVGFVVSSKYRVGVMEEVAQQPKTPTEISDDADIKIQHASRALSELRERDLVELLVSDGMQKGRIYGLTEKGKSALESVKERS